MPGFWSIPLFSTCFIFFCLYTNTRAETIFIALMVYTFFPLRGQKCSGFCLSMKLRSLYFNSTSAFYCSIIIRVVISFSEAYFYFRMLQYQDKAVLSIAVFQNQCSVGQKKARFLGFQYILKGLGTAPDNICIFDSYS